MSHQSINVLVLSILATQPVVAGRFVAATGRHAAAQGKAIGVANSNAAVGEWFPVTVLGTATVTAAEILATDQRVQVGADGVAALQAGTGVPVAVVLEAAAAGDSIEVLLIPN
jgi:hypothetical protein